RGCARLFPGSRPDSPSGHSASTPRGSRWSTGPERGRSSPATSVGCGAGPGTARRRRRWRCAGSRSVTATEFLVERGQRFERLEAFVIGLLLVGQEVAQAHAAVGAHL